MPTPIKREFSDKYDEEHAQNYLLKHQDNLARRLSHKRDEQLARGALAMAGEPGLVLDLPCGAGRFWPLLAEKPNRVIIGADNSESMLKVAMVAAFAAAFGRHARRDSPAASTRFRTFSTAHSLKFTLKILACSAVSTASAVVNPTQSVGDFRLFLTGLPLIATRDTKPGRPVPVGSGDS